MLSKEEFSGRLKAAIERKQMKQVDIAEEIGITAANMSNYVRGKAFPPVDTLAEIAKKLDVSLDWLCGVEKQKQSQQDARTIGEVASSIMCILSSLPFEHRLETIQINEKQQVGERELVDGYGAFPIYEDVEISVPAIAFTDGEIRTFLEDLMKMKKLLSEKTFDFNFYKRWLNDRIQALDEIPTFLYSLEDSPL